VSAHSIPWWSPGIPVQADHKATWRDLWDALFGRRVLFYKVEHDGSWFICEANDVNDWMNDGCEYTISHVLMTRRQFENLPEFGGF
jgi:hypothetical protein